MNILMPQSLVSTFVFYTRPITVKSLEKRTPTCLSFLIHIIELPKVAQLETGGNSRVNQFTLPKLLLLSSAH